MQRELVFFTAGGNPRRGQRFEHRITLKRANYCTLKMRFLIDGAIVDATCSRQLFLLPGGELAGNEAGEVVRADNHTQKGQLLYIEDAILHCWCDSRCNLLSSALPSTLKEPAW